MLRSSPLALGLLKTNSDLQRVTVQREDTTDALPCALSDVPHVA